MSKYVEVEAIYWDATFDERYVIDNAPSIDIVFCKECIFADGDDKAEMYRCCSVSFPYWNKGEHFCADGERREP